MLQQARIVEERPDFKIIIFVIKLCYRAARLGCLILQSAGFCDGKYFGDVLYYLAQECAICLIAEPNLM